MCQNNRATMRKAWKLQKHEAETDLIVMRVTEGKWDNSLVAFQHVVLFFSPEELSHNLLTLMLQLLLYNVMRYCMRNLLIEANRKGEWGEMCALKLLWVACISCVIALQWSQVTTQIQELLLYSLFPLGVIGRNSEDSFPITFLFHCTCVLKGERQDFQDETWQCIWLTYFSN